MCIALKVDKIKFIRFQEENLFAFIVLAFYVTYFMILFFSIFFFFASTQKTQLIWIHHQYFE